MKKSGVIKRRKKDVRLFWERNSKAGFTYFDTAYVYLGSEAAARKALVERYPRDSFTLATKLNALMTAPTEKAAKKQFYTSLERTGAGYFDYYLLHALMEDNLSYMKQFEPLNEEEQSIIREAQKILGKSSAIPCTACHYCTEGCPKKIPIPEIFSAMNKQLGNGQMAEAVSDYRKATGSGGRASECINCGQCERACPQRLKVTDYLKQCAEKLEN